MGIEPAAIMLAAGTAAAALLEPAGHSDGLC